MKKLIVMILVVATALVVGLATTQADILIATAGPMTGQYASFGQQMKDGAEMAGWAYKVAGRRIDGCEFADVAGSVQVWR